MGAAAFVPFISNRDDVVVEVVVLVFGLADNKVDGTVVFFTVVVVVVVVTAGFGRAAAVVVIVLDAKDLWNKTQD